MQRRVFFHGDGLSLSPAEVAGLLTQVTAAPGGVEADSYSRGGVVAELENRVARLLNKECAIFLPTGTMANHLAVRALCAGRGPRVLAQAESHLVNDAGDCAQVLSGLNVMPLVSDNTCFSGADVTAALERAARGKVASPLGAVSIETPVRRLDNAAVALADLVEVTGVAREAGLGLHLDGARLPLYTAHLGVSPAEVAALFDTVYVSLYKCFSAPSGAVLAGPKTLLDGMHHTRRLLGGGMPAAWPFAALALPHLDGFAEQSVRVLAMAEDVFESLVSDGRCQVTRVEQGTNVFRLRLVEGSADAWRRSVAERGVELPVADAETGEFVCKMNPSWLRSSAAELVQALLG